MSVTETTVNAHCSQLLGIDRSASERDIKRAYRTLSKKHHPDKNPGNDSARQKFVEVSTAYEALYNKETRRIYDQYGHEGLEQHQRGGGAGAHHHDPFDLFSRFFGGGGHFGGGSGQRRGPNMEVRVELPLRDFYNGADHEINVAKQQICEDCEGSGSADGKVEPCGTCRGQGMVIQKLMLAPGIFQQVQQACDKCGGKGQRIMHKCKVCQGKKVVDKVVTHSLHVERGFPRGAKVSFENEANESPDFVAGDLVVQMSEKPAGLGAEDKLEERTDGTYFRRKGRHLFWKEVLGLREAWMGDWSRNLTHLDGHVVRLSRKRGEVVQPGMVEVVKGEGMPVRSEEQGKDDADWGDLLVEYSVVMPDQMESGMEKDFWVTWEKWRKERGVDLGKDSGRDLAHKEKDEL